MKNGYGEYVDRFNFNSNDDNEESNFEKVTIEICDTRDEFKKLLNQDFENNIIVYWEVMGGSCKVLKGKYFGSSYYFWNVKLYIVDI